MAKKRLDLDFEFNTPLLHIAATKLILTAIEKTFRKCLSYCENVVQLA